MIPEDKKLFMELLILVKEMALECNQMQKDIQHANWNCEKAMNRMNDREIRYEQFIQSQVKINAIIEKFIRENHD